MATTEGNLKHSHIKEARALRHAVVLTWQHVPKQPTYGNKGFRSGMSVDKNHSNREILLLGVLSSFLPKTRELEN